MANPFWLILCQEVRLAWAGKGQALAVLAFYLISATLFPFTFGTEPALLQKVGPGILWVLALLVTTFTIPMLLERDLADGTLDQYRMQPIALEWIMAAKALGLWICCLMPVLVALPLIAQLYYLSWEICIRLWLSLLPGTVAMLFMGMVQAGIALGMRGSGIMPLLLALPLYLPVLIFGYAYCGSTGGYWGLEMGILLSLAGLFIALGSLVTALLVRE